MRFLIDEGLPRSLGVALAQDGHDVTAVADSSFRGATDAALWLLAGAQQRVILTRDRGFVHPGLTPAPAAIVVFRVPDLWTGADIAAFGVRTLGSLPPAELLGYVTVLERGRTRRRPLVHFA